MDSLSENNIKSPLIRLELTYHNDSTRISVEDNGPGIAEDQLDKIFMPFYTTRKKGSGIGLALSRQIAHLHKGTITVESHPNEMTRFVLSI